MTRSSGNQSRMTLESSSGGYFCFFQVQPNKERKVSVLRENKKTQGGPLRYT